MDEPVERMRQALPSIVGPDYRARMGEAEVAALAEPERGNRATWAGTMRQEAAMGGGDLLGRLAENRAATLVIHADADAADSLEHGQALAPGFHLATVPSGALTGIGDLFKGDGVGHEHTSDEDGRIKSGASAFTWTMRSYVLYVGQSG